MTDDLIKIYKVSKKLMPLVHLPVQSGSDKILKLMNRKHKIDHYLKVYDELKKLINQLNFQVILLLVILVKLKKTSKVQSI